MSECLSEQQLEQLAGGMLEGPEAPALRAHAESCPECREALAEWRANAAFVARVAQALPGSARSSRKSGSSGSSGATRLLNEALGVPKVDAIPGYTIIREIHRGGQGVVYEAVQRSTRRTVAVKVMIEGPFASERARWRFEREIRLIASLKHPHIVVVHDSGVSDDRHYFAMDYIQGRPLDAYVRAAGLDPRAIVRLFLQVADAVSYAHRKGVMHRDLKPSNILVNEEGSPFVLDFGLAKLTGDEALESAGDLRSIAGHLMGTLRYMSPEQTAGKPDEIDVRTDVYSLGVILYELLAERVPYETARADITTAIRNIREAEPPRLTRTHRHVGSELEAIVLKALEKDPRRRYQSAGELAEDLKAWLEGRPVAAKSASSLYVIRKLARRHWYTTTMAACFAAVVLAGPSLWHWQLGKTVEARQQARQSDSAFAALAADRTAAEQGGQAVRASLFGWFLAEWNAGRLAQARALPFHPGSPEGRAAAFLLDEQASPDRLLSEMPERHKQLAYFVIGERAMKADRREDAVAAFRESASRARQARDDVIFPFANARLEQLGAQPVPAPEDQRAQHGEDTPRNNG
ncbi:MAG: hypothetical protein AMXMBFR83_05130 [Phycisphaerae bacterium]